MTPEDLARQIGILSGMNRNKEQGLSAAFSIGNRAQEELRAGRASERQQKQFDASMASQREAMAQRRKEANLSGILKQLSLSQRAERDESLDEYRDRGLELREKQLSQQDEHFDQREARLGDTSKRSMDIKEDQFSKRESRLGDEFSKRESRLSKGDESKNQRAAESRNLRKSMFEKSLEGSKKSDKPKTVQQIAAERKANIFNKQYEEQAKAEQQGPLYDPDYVPAKMPDDAKREEQNKTKEQKEIEENEVKKETALRKQARAMALKSLETYSGDVRKPDDPKWNEFVKREKEYYDILKSANGGKGGPGGNEGKGGAGGTADTFSENRNVMARPSDWPEEEDWNENDPELHKYYKEWKGQKERRDEALEPIEAVADSIGGAAATSLAAPLAIGKIGKIAKTVGSEISDIFAAAKAGKSIAPAARLIAPKVAPAVPIAESIILGDADPMKPGVDIPEIKPNVLSKMQLPEKEIAAIVDEYNVKPEDVDEITKLLMESGAIKEDMTLEEINASMRNMMPKLNDIDPLPDDIVKAAQKPFPPETPTMFTPMQKRGMIAGNLKNAGPEPSFANMPESMKEEIGNIVRNKELDFAPDANWYLDSMNRNKKLSDEIYKTKIDSGFVKEGDLTDQHYMVQGEVIGSPTIKGLPEQRPQKLKPQDRGMAVNPLPLIGQGLHNVGSFVKELFTAPNDFRKQELLDTYLRADPKHVKRNLAREDKLLKKLRDEVKLGTAGAKEALDKYVSRLKAYRDEIGVNPFFGASDPRDVNRVIPELPALLDQHMVIANTRHAERMEALKPFTDTIDAKQEAALLKNYKDLLAGNQAGAIPQKVLDELIYLDNEISAWGPGAQQNAKAYRDYLLGTDRSFFEFMNDWSKYVWRHDVVTPKIWEVRKQFVGRLDGQRKKYADALFTWLAGEPQAPEAAAQAISDAVYGQIKKSPVLETARKYGESIPLLGQTVFSTKSVADKLIKLRQRFSDAIFLFNPASPMFNLIFGTLNNFAKLNTADFMKGTVDTVKNWKQLEKQLQKLGLQDIPDVQLGTATWRKRLDKLRYSGMHMTDLLTKGIAYYGARAEATQAFDKLLANGRFDQFLPKNPGARAAVMKTLKEDFINTVARDHVKLAQQVTATLNNAPMFNDPVMGALLQYERGRIQDADLFWRDIVYNNALQGNAAPLLRYFIAAGTTIALAEQAGFDLTDKIGFNPVSYGKDIAKGNLNPLPHTGFEGTSRVPGGGIISGGPIIQLFQAGGRVYDAAKESAQLGGQTGKLRRAAVDSLKEILSLRIKGGVQLRRIIDNLLFPAGSDRRGELEERGVLPIKKPDPYDVSAIESARRTTGIPTVLQRLTQRTRRIGALDDPDTTDIEERIENRLKRDSKILGIK